MRASESSLSAGRPWRQNTSSRVNLRMAQAGLRHRAAMYPYPADGTGEGVRNSAPRPTNRRGAKDALLVSLRLSREAPDVAVRK